MMRRKHILFWIGWIGTALILMQPVFCDQYAVTEDGKQVLLKDDGTWEYVHDKQKEESKKRGEEKQELIYKTGSGNWQSDALQTSGGQIQFRWFANDPADSMIQFEVLQNEGTQKVKSFISLIAEEVTQNSIALKAGTYWLKMKTNAKQWELVVEGFESDQEFLLYTIQCGDTVSSIAKEHGISEITLQILNDFNRETKRSMMASEIYPEMIYWSEEKKDFSEFFVGQELRIPVRK